MIGKQVNKQLGSVGNYGTMAQGFGGRREDKDAKYNENAPEWG